jgi:hypothetical protein
MSKFLLNLLVQISKVWVYSKIKLLFGKEFFPHFQPNRPSGQPPHTVFRPSRGHFFFKRPLPLSPLGLGPSVGPARPLSPPGRPARLPPPSRGNASPRAAFTPLRARLTSGPHLSSPSSSSARARSRHRRISPPPATTQHLEMLLSYPVPRNRERSLHTCAQDVQITRMATI